MRYEQVQRAFYGNAWAILPDAYRVIHGIIQDRAAGINLTDEELRERVDGKLYGAARDGTPTEGQPGVAVVALHGPIISRAGAFERMSGMTSPQDFANAVREAATEPSVNAIILDVDSPGGTVSGTHDAAMAVREAARRKPVIAVANDMMASAAYYIGSQATRIVALPSAVVGSIGVIMAHKDLTKADEQLGVKTTVLRTGPRKAVGRSDEELTDEARAELTSQLEDHFQVFLEAVAEGRGLPTGEVRERFGDGAVMVGAAALESGLVDGLGTLGEAIAGALDQSNSASLMERDAAAPVLAPGWVPESAIDGQQFGKHAENLRSTVVGARDSPNETRTPSTPSPADEENSMPEEHTPTPAPEVENYDLPPDVRAQLAETEALRERAAAAEARAQQYEEEQQNARFTQAAEAYAHLPINAQEFGPVLRQVSEASPEAYTEIARVLAAAEEQLAQSAVMREVGANGEAPVNGSLGRLQAAAKRLQADNPNLSNEEAFKQACSQNPSLYDAYTRGE